MRQFPVAIPSTRQSGVIGTPSMLSHWRACAPSNSAGSRVSECNQLKRGLQGSLWRYIPFRMRNMRPSWLERRGNGGPAPCFIGDRHDRRRLAELFRTIIPFRKRNIRPHGLAESRNDSTPGGPSLMKACLSGDGPRLKRRWWVLTIIPFRKRNIRPHGLAKGNDGAPGPVSHESLRQEMARDSNVAGGD